LTLLELLLFCNVHHTSVWDVIRVLLGPIFASSVMRATVLTLKA